MKSRQIWIQFWFIITAILCVMLTVDAQGCHKLCTCMNKKVTCVGNETNRIDSTVLPDILAWTPADTLKITILAAHLPKITNVFSRFTELRGLSLMACNITEISQDAFLKLTKLTEIHISDNPLKNFTVDIFKTLTSLVTANFTHNALDTLQANEFRGLRSLKNLYLRRNMIKTLTKDSFHSDLKNLENLYIHQNLLGEIANDTFENLLNLKVLDIGWQSPQVHIPPGIFSPLKKLNLLFLTDLLNHTKNNELPKGFLIGLDSLTGLDIRLNNLRALNPGDFTPVQKTLKNLYAGHNHFRNISKGVFENLTALEVLDLTGCKIQMVAKGSFDSLPQLKVLNLQWNDIEILTPDILQPIQNATIMLQHNAFQCDCRMLDTLRWIQSENLVFNLTCGWPPRLQRKKVHKMPEADLRCQAPDVFDGKPEIKIGAEEYMPVILKCWARSYDHSANMSYNVLDGDPIPDKKLKSVKKSYWNRWIDHETVYYTEIHINLTDIRLENSGKIKCTAWNKYGNDSGLLEIKIYPQRWGVPLWALIIGILVVALLVGLCIGLALYYYRRKSVPISRKFQSPAKYARQDNEPKPQHVAAISSSTTVLHPDYGNGGYDHYNGEHNMAYLQEAPSMYVTYV